MLYCGVITEISGMFAMDYILIYYLIFGIAAGVFVGIIPGIGNTFMLILFFPFLINTDPLYLIVFSMAMLSISQYTGSITSIIFSAPGETSSMPALYEGHRMYLDGRGSFALSGCAFGSTLGALIAMFFTMFVISNLQSYAVFYSTKTQFYILAGVLVFLIFNRSNHWAINIMLMIFGYSLGLIGVNSLDWTKSITFGFDSLISGIPMFVVLFWLFIFPQILNSWSKLKTSNSQQDLLLDHSTAEHLKLFLSNTGSAIRGTVIGFFAGLIPYLTTIAASNFSYSVESWIQKKKKSYNNKGDYASLISAETANNAAGFSSFLPLLAIGVPLAPSDAIVLNLATLNGYVFSIENFMSMFSLLAVCLVFVNIAGLLISWPVVQNIKGFYKIDFNYIYPAVMIISILMLFYLGDQTNQMLYFAAVSLILAPIGYLLRNFNTIPLVFVFLLQNAIEENFIRFIFYL